jgi:RNA polymerase sigma-70 factor (ECF subfamily)
MSAVEASGIEALLRHAPCVQRLARRLADGASADDAAQEVWLAALAHDRVPIADPRAWLASVLRRAVRRLRRGERRRQAREQRAARAESLPSTLEVVERLTTQQAVAASLLALAPPERDLLIQRFYLDLTLREIAAREGIPVSTAEGRVTRALDRLRADLARRLGVRGGRGRLALGLATLAAPPRRPPRWSPAPIGALAAAGVAAALVAVHFATGARRPAPGGAPQVAATLHHAEAPSSSAGLDGSRARPRREPSAESADRTRPVLAALRVELAADARASAEPSVVVLSPAPGFLPAGGGRSALARGAVRFEELPPGPWRVETDRGGVAAVTLAPGEAEVVLALPPGPSLQGVVLDPRGEPVPFAAVWLSPPTAAGDGVTRPFVDDLASVRADRSGRFQIASIGAARTVGARADGWAPSEVDCAGRAEVELVLPGRGGTITGVVRDARGVPRVGARVYLDAGGGDAHLVRQRTDGAGAFHFESVAPGRRRIEVRADGSALTDAPVEVAAGRAGELEIVTGPGFSLAGRVTDEGGRPRAGALVFAALRPWTMLPDERDGVLARCDAEGRYRLAHVAPRAAWIVADDGAGRRAEVLVRGLAGAELRRDITLRPGPVLAGRVLDQAGLGIPDLELAVVSPDQWPPRRTRSGADGRFALTVHGELAHRILLAEHGVRLARETLARPGSGEIVLRLADAERPDELRTIVLEPAAAAGTMP